MIKRLRIKFICITMAIITVMLTVMMISQINSTKNTLIQRNMQALEDAFQENLEDQPEMRPGDSGPGKAEPQKPKPDKPIFVRPTSDSPCFVLYLDGKGVLVASGSGYYDLSDRELLMNVYQRAVDKDKASGGLWEYKLQYLRTVIGGRTVYAFTDISDEIETIQEMMNSSVIIWTASFLCLLALSIFLANWAIRPVEQAWEQQRQFVADASHELKTPLTVILTNAELLRERSEDEDQRQFSDSIVTMSRQMRGLVDSLLQLARADSGQTAVEREKLDWSALVEQSLLPFEPLYFEAGLTLESSVQPGIHLTGNAVQLRRVTEVLLDNALKYASPGGTVRVKLESRGLQCCLSVASPGQTLTAKQCRDIFKRFYRVDPARRRTGSYGLGLAIAERVVSDHRGRIWAEGRDGVNTFYVNLPMG